MTEPMDTRALIGQLRYEAEGDDTLSTLCGYAAEEIDRLTRERDELRAELDHEEALHKETWDHAKKLEADNARRYTALQMIANHVDTESDFPHNVVGFQNFARYALEQSAAPSDFVAPLTRPTQYFQGQDDLVRLLLSFGLKEHDMHTVVHLVARALEQSACPDHPTGRMVDNDGNRICSRCGRSS